MRRFEPQASVTLPRLAEPIAISEGGWEVKAPPRLNVQQKKAPVSARGGQKLEAHPAEASLTARGVAGEVGLTSPSAPPRSASGGDSDPAVAPKQGATKGKTIETWLNHTLEQAKAESTASPPPTGGGTKNKQGLSTFGVDVAALEKLGLDTVNSERVYRAMFVYSQGMHGVLHEAAGRCKSPSQAMVVLWRAFKAVLEHVGQNHADAEERLARLARQTHEQEERARMESAFNAQLAALKEQLEQITEQRDALEVRVQELEQEEERLQSENDLFINTHQVTVSRYEREKEQRVEFEAKYLEKSELADALQLDLANERKMNKQQSLELAEATQARDDMQSELESLRYNLKTLEAQAANFKQAMLEAAQQKQRQEQQVSQLTASLEKSAVKITELREQLDHETETNKQQAEVNAALQRDLRRIQTKHEDELHVRKELQQERDALRERVEKVEKEWGTVLEERRTMQKEINEANMKNRKDQIDLKRTTEQLQRTEASLEKIEAAHMQLRNDHHHLVAEAENMRQDIQHLYEQMRKESELRKSLQTDKKQLQSQLQTVTIERDTAEMAANNTQRELAGVTEKMVKLESIVRETKSAMSKAQLEHQVELKANAQKVVMLEKVIADERKERRNLVMEAQEQTERREDALNEVRKKELEMHDLRRERLEKEQEADRLKVLLKAQEQRNAEQLVTLDKYHASVASYDAEMRRMHVLLECEQEEARQKLEELQQAYSAERRSLEQRIDEWKMCYEDVVSQLNFNPATTKLQEVTLENTRLREELLATQKIVKDGEVKVRECEDLLQAKDREYEALERRLTSVKEQQSELTDYMDALMRSHEHRSMEVADSEVKIQRLLAEILALESKHIDYEHRILELQDEVETLSRQFHKPTADGWTQVDPVIREAQEQQTDLSYQYLEASEHLQTEPTRTERLNNLKKASHFVDDLVDARDFTFKTKTVVHGHELRFEPQHKTKIVRVGQPVNTQPGSPPKMRSTPSPWN